MQLKIARIKKAKRTWIGKIACRLLGEELGAVAMEYVVIALLIVAAAVGAAVYFGRTIKGGLEAAADMVTNASDSPETTAEAATAKLKTVGAEGTKTSKAVNRTITGDDHTGAGASEEED